MATIDYGLLRFDAFKRRGTPQEPAVCLHPTVLLQILQFWVPNSESLEAALMTSLRPVPPRFDGKAERVTVKIISSLSRFEAIDDLSVEAITNVVLSDAVRGRIAKAKGPEEELEAVRTGVVEENRLLEMRAERYRRDAKGLAQTVKGRDTAITALEDRIQLAVAELDAAGAALRAEKARKDGLEVQLAKAQRDLSAVTGEMRTEKLLRRAYRSAVGWGVGIAAFSSGITIVIVTILRERITSVSAMASAIAIGVILAVGIGTEKAHHVLKRLDLDGVSPVPEWLGKCKKWCWAVLTALVIAGLAAGLFG